MHYCLACKKTRLSYYRVHIVADAHSCHTDALLLKRETPS